MRYRYIRRNFLKVLVVGVFFVSIGCGFILRHLEKPFADAFAAYAAEVGNSAVNYAVNECLSDVSYNDLIILNENENSQLISMSANGIKISKLKGSITENIKNYINNHKDGTLNLRVGAAQNNFLLSALGPRIKVRVSPTSVTKTEFRDEFVSAGINQVRHCIYLDITMSVTVTSFNMRSTQKITNSVLVADTVIIGQVPDLYGGYFSQLNKTME